MSNDNLEPKGSLWILIIAVLIVLSASVFYFGQKNTDFTTAPTPTTPEASRPARTYTVFYSDGVFSPTNIRVHAGDTVKFENDSTGPIYVISNDTNGKLLLAGFDSGNSMAPGSTFTFTFNNAGIFAYHNDLKETETGTVTVRP